MLQDYERSFPHWNQYHLYQARKKTQIAHRQDAAEKKQKHHCTLCTPDRRIGGFPKEFFFLNSPAAKEMHRRMSVSAFRTPKTLPSWLAYGLIGCCLACLVSPSFPKRGRIETCIPTHAVLPRNDRKTVEAFMDGQYIHLNSCHVIKSVGATYHKRKRDST